MTERFGLRTELQELIATRVSSYEELEVLLALQGRRGELCRVSLLAQLTGLPEGSVEEAGAGLCRRGLAVSEPGRVMAFRYAPVDAGEDALVSELAVTYRERKLDVIRAMTAMALERLRMRGAEAFRAIRDGQDDD